MAKDAFDKNWERSLFKGALVKRTSNATSTSGVTQTISWQTAAYDTNGFWDSTAPTRLTVRPGIKFAKLLAAVEMDSSDANRTRISILKNGGNSFIGNAIQTTTVGTGSTIISGSSAVVEVVETDYFEVSFAQTSGSGRSITAGNNTWFSIEAIS